MTQGVDGFRVKPGMTQGVDGFRIKSGMIRCFDDLSSTFHAKMQWTGVTWPGVVGMINDNI